MPNKYIITIITKATATAIVNFVIIRGVKLF